MLKTLFNRVLSGIVVVVVATSMLPSQAATTIAKLSLDNASDANRSCVKPAINDSGYVAVECYTSPYAIYAGPSTSTSLERFVSTIEEKLGNEDTKKEVDLHPAFMALSNTNAIFAKYNYTLNNKPNAYTSEDLLYFYNNGLSSAANLYPLFLSLTDVINPISIYDPLMNDSDFISDSSTSTGEERVFVVNAAFDQVKATPSPVTVTSSDDGNCRPDAMTNNTINSWPALAVRCIKEVKKNEYAGTNKYATAQSGGTTYQTQTIPSPDGYICGVFELNNKFHAAGVCENNKGISFAAFWADPTKAPTLFQGTPTGETAAAPFSKDTFAFNDLDHVLVTYKDKNGNSRILLWQTDLGANVYQEVGVTGSNYEPIGLASNDTYVYIKSSNGTDTTYYRTSGTTSDQSLADITGAPKNLKATSLSKNGLWIAGTSNNTGDTDGVYRVSLSN